jgi:hypothetical protein
MFMDDRKQYDFSEPGLWPSESQELLLQAGLWEGRDALEAWDRWRASADLDAEMDRGTFRLLPMLYKKMLALGVEDPLMKQLGSVYRWSWVESNQILRHMKPVLNDLQREAIPTLLLKGAPLAYEFYDFPGMRPMADFDVLIPIADVSRAVRLLSGLGWKPQMETPEDFYRFRHSIPFINESEQEFDLHWHALTEIRNESVDQELWANSVPFRIDGIDSRRLDTTDSLIHAVVHGIRWNPEPPIRWIADAMVLITKDPDNVNWDRIKSFAKKHHLAYRLTLGLRYLKERMGANVPDDVLRYLRESDITLIERLERITTLSAPDEASISLFRGFTQNLCEYQRIAASQDAERAPPGFLDYICYRKKVSGPSELGKSAARHLWRWGRRRLGFSNDRLTATS